MLIISIKHAFFLSITLLSRNEPLYGTYNLSLIKRIRPIIVVRYREEIPRLIEKSFGIITNDKKVNLFRKKEEN